MSVPLVIAITGASGVIYGVKLLRALKKLDFPAHLVISDAAARTILIETNESLDDVRKLASVVYSNKDIGATISSGSFKTRGMIVAPCSIKTLSAITNSFNWDLISRAADVTLKEGRPLILMVRETPLHKGHLELMVRAADLGAIVLPPMPAFYNRPESIEDIISHTVGRVLDQFGIEHDLFRRWTGPGARANRQGEDDA